MDKEVFQSIIKADPRLLVTGVIAFLGLIGPIALELFIVSPEVFQLLSVPKLLLLSFGIGVPLALLNILLCFESTKNDPPSETEHVTPSFSLVAGLSMTAFLLYANILLQFLIGYGLRPFVWVGIGMEALIIAWSVVQIRDSRKAAKKTEMVATGK